MAAAGGKTIEQMYQKMTPLEHIKKLPDTYIGSIERTDAEMWVWNQANQRMEKAHRELYSRSLQNFR